MTLQLQTARILYSRIDAGDTRFRLAPGPIPPPAAELKNSIAAVGLLHPPILKKTAQGAFVVVSGHGRLRAAHEVFSQTSYVCLALPPTTPDKEALAVAVEAIRIKRVVTPMEQAIFFRKMLRHMTEQEIAERFPLSPGRASTPHRIRQILALADLEEPLAIALHNGSLHEGVARELLALPFTDRLALFEIIEFLQLSVGNQQKLARTCIDLAKRCHASVISLLGTPEVQAIVSHPEANPPQKTANLLRLLTEKQYPRLSRAEKEFQKFTTDLGLPPGVTLTHSPSFEEDTLSLTLGFRNKEELEACWPAMAKGLPPAKK